MYAYCVYVYIIMPPPLTYCSCPVDPFRVHGTVRGGGQAQPS